MNNVIIPASTAYGMMTEQTFAHSKAFLFVMDHYVKLLKAGYGDNEISFSNHSLVSYALDKTGKVVSASVWSYDANRRAVSVLFSATLETERGKGLYRKVFAEVERNAKLKGAVVIFSGVHVDNGPMIKAAKQTGRNLSWYRVKKILT